MRMAHCHSSGGYWLRLARFAAGSVAAAAHELGISETTTRQHLSGLYRRTGCLNAAQAAYRLGMGGLAD